MSENNVSPLAAATDNALPKVALARRQMLLRGLGKGSVVMVAAAVPMHTLASPSTGERTKTKEDFHKPAVWAAVSGCHSAVGSRAPQDTPVSKGHGCGHYTTKSNWKGYDSDSRKDQSCVDKRFKDVFQAGSDKKCYDIVKSQTSDECRWVLAYVNAQKCHTTAMRYPYSADEIIDMYKNPTKYGAKDRKGCQDFFHDYMETES